MGGETQHMVFRSITPYGSPSRCVEVYHVRVTRLLDCRDCVHCLCLLEGTIGCKMLRDLVVDTVLCFIIEWYDPRGHVSGFV